MTEQKDRDEIASDEVAFRTSVLVHLDYMKDALDEMKLSLADHIKDDNARFNTVNQKIGDNSSSIAKGAGIVAGLVFMIGVIMYIVDKVQS